ncbi:MAG: NUDIX domain-containing protein [Acidobacteriota bacterium]
MPKRSAGILMYRVRSPHPEVFLVHPGGPFWAKKDLGAWTVPKGEYDDSESPLDAARRELQEETGFAADGPFHALGEVRQSSGKIVTAFACKGDCNPAELVSNFCEVEWPPRSGRRMEIPEVDRGAWFTLEEAHDRIFTAQRPFLDRLKKLVDASHASA